MYRYLSSHLQDLKFFLDESDIHLAARSVFSGLTPGDVYVDNLLEPKTMFVQSHHRYMFYGSSENIYFNQDIQDLFTDSIIPLALQNKQWGFDVYYSTPGWAEKIPCFINSEKYYKVPKQHWYINESRPQPVILPDGIVLKMVDRSLLADSDYAHMDLLREEMCSETDSVETFLSRCFGVCAVQNHSLVGWCLSEYNASNRCEIGIATVPEYRGQGIATAMVHAFSNYAFTHGIQKIGWHCSSRNIASWKTAQKAGLQKGCDYDSYLVDLSGAAG